MRDVADLAEAFAGGASVIAAVAAATALLAVAASTAPPPVTPTGFDLGRIELTDAAGAVRILPVWIADTDAELQRGLMGVTELGRADGMLFVFDATADWRFYMWQTLIPLSIAWFAEDGTFVGAAEMVPCTSDDESRVRPLLAGYAVSVCGRTAVGRGGAVGAHH